MPTGLDTETLNMVVSAINDFAGQRLPPDLLRQLDHEDACPEDVLRDMYGPQFGVHLLFIPEAYGGMGGGAYDVYRVSEAIARVDLGVASAVLATFLGLDPIVVGGTPEQRQKWMSRVAEEGLLVAYGVTEPTAGSDLAASRTRADPVHEDGQLIGYRLNGNKQFITNGSIADLYTVLAVAPGGFTFFIIEEGAEGFHPEKPEDKHGIRISDTAPLTLEDVFVPIENVVGGVEGQGMVQATEVFGYTRLMVAAFGLGAGMKAIEIATEYAKERVQAGAPLIEKQAYTHKLLVPHLVRLEAARAYIEETAHRIDAGEAVLNTEGAIAKLVATEAGNAAADAAIQALGGYGYMKEYEVEKIRRDVRITTIYEGTSEIMEWTISRDRWRDNLQQRGQYYARVAPSVEALHTASPDVGADVAALAMRALHVLIEHARVQRLTRNQHVLFRLGEWIAAVEVAASFARYAADPREKVSPFPADVVKAMSRVYAREAAALLACEGLRWIYGADETANLAQLSAAMNLPALQAAQRDLVDDMDHIAAALRDISFA